VPSYALAALLKHRARASEASLKYVVYGGATSGVMLYGISLITGIANSAHLPTVAAELAQRLPTLQGDERMVLVLGGLMLMVGLAFKLSAVPFHFWCPDVFEGATAEINAFLSVASKAAALGLLVRVAIGIGVSAPPALPTGLTGGPSAETCLIEADSTDGLVALAGDRAQTRFAEIRRRAWEPPSRSAIPTLASGFRLNEAMAHAPLARATTEDSAAAGTNLSAIQDFIAKLITLLAIITCTFGNLAAYGQTNIKRLFAYSTIAHAGYMMMAVPPVMALAGTAPALAEKAAAALGIYVAVYLFMNLAAFAVIAFLRNAMQSEEIADYAGLVRHCPGLVIFFSITLFGLIGLPPLSGFVGKFAIFASLAEGFGATGQAYLLGLLLVGAVNTAISLFYYVRVVKVMTIDPDAETRGPVAFPLVSLPGIYVVAVTLPTVALFFLWNFLNEYALAAARQLLG
jgi:NADH-quinone oxidoreductase subunit N